MPPSFESQEYWNNRFSRDSSAFDWLIPADAFGDVIQEYLGEGKESEILHIGCGTSDANVLRSAVRDPRQIQNVDFSLPAIEASASREREAFGPSQHDDAAQMRWECLDLLSVDSVSTLLGAQESPGRLFDLVLDKSTSDSIACGINMSLDLPYPLSVNGWTRSIAQTGIRHTVNIHPLHILAVNLAALTVPDTGRWIVISYSEDRLPFLPPYPTSLEHGFLTDEIIKHGFSHPNQLWRLERKEQITFDPHQDETLAERRRRLANGTVHRPPTRYWLYVLVRTTAVVTG